MNTVTGELLFTFQHVSINSLYSDPADALISLFTFQHVSINSLCILSLYLRFSDLHSNMYLLILLYPANMARSHDYLHSNMYLLIRVGICQNTNRHVNLHSNMYLLIHSPCECFDVSAQYLHSNMYLLIPGKLDS